ncbi:MAG: T9SS type A sorting domain-containing protein [Flavobacteriales bacterium]|nr:T9SS type A sorting domain-containing protein [Flavobacteriales bacterium]
MKLKSILFLLAALPLSAFAQFEFEKESSDTARAPQTAFSIDAHNEFSTVDSGTFRWVRLSKDLPSKVTSAICDNNLCYGPEDDSADFFMAENSSFAMTCYFYPNSGCGTSEVSLKVYKPNDPAAGVAYTVFHGEIWCTAASVSTFQAGEIQISPNPATDHVYVHYGSSNLKTLRVVDVLGNVLLEKEFTGVSERVDVSRWTKGIYFATVTEGNHSIVKSFIKN